MSVSFGFLDSMAWRMLLACAVIALLGYLDLVTGADVSISLFYLIPVSLAAWKGNLSEAVGTSVLSAFTCFTADFFSGKEYGHGLISFWNTFIRLGSFVVVALLVNRVRELLLYARNSAGHDYLTGLLNSRSFYELVEHERLKAERYNLYCMLAYIDLDNFKQVNDTWGHLEGDRLLKTVADAIKHNIRKVDIAARLGGDEFALFVPHMTADESRNIIEKISHVLLDAMKDNNWPVTFSIGSVFFRALPDSVRGMIQTADDLMYRVKKSGKNAVQYSDYTCNSE